MGVAAEALAGRFGEDDVGQIAEALATAGSVALRAVTVREKGECANGVAHDEVEVAVAVEVDERGRAVFTDVDAVEGVRGAGPGLVGR